MSSEFSAYDKQQIDCITFAMFILKLTFDYLNLSMLEVSETDIRIRKLHNGI